jgi:hypothetical protein
VISLLKQTLPLLADFDVANSEIRCFAMAEQKRSATLRAFTPPVTVLRKGEWAATLGTDCIANIAPGLCSHSFRFLGGGREVHCKEHPFMDVI